MKRPDPKNYSRGCLNDKYFDVSAYVKDLDLYVDLLEYKIKDDRG